MIAALYGRTSKEKDDTFSVSSQIDATSAYARNNGFTVPTEYVFRETHTGRVLDRPELAKLRFTTGHFKTLRKEVDTVW